MMRVARLLVAAVILWWLGVAPALAEIPPEAKDAHGKGNYPEAIRLLEAYLLQEPGDDAARVFLLDCYRAVHAADRLHEVLRHTEGAVKEGLILKAGRGAVDELDLGALQRLTRLPDLESIRQAEDLGTLAESLDLGRIAALRDYVSMSKFYEKLGDVNGMFGGLKEILALDPNHAAANLKMGLLLAKEGKVEEAESHFLRYLVTTDLPLSLQGLYALAYVNAQPFALASLVFIVMGASLLFWRFWSQGLSRRVTLVSTLAVSSLVGLLAAGSWFAGRGLPAFLILLLLVLAVAAGLLLRFLRAYGGSLVRAFERTILRLWRGGMMLASGRLSRRLSRISARYLLLILLFLPPLAASIIPAIPQYDLRLILLVATGIILFSIIGALALSFLEKNTSLGRTLTYISLFNTIPFLVIFVYLAGGVMEKVLFLSFDSLEVWESRLFIATSILYLVGLVFAMYLAVIQTQAILAPVRALTEGVERVESGDLKVSIPPVCVNELGHLSQGFNRMVEGLRQREFIRATFGKFVDPRVVERVLARGSIDLGGRSTRCVVMFTDIRGFTSMSEQLTPSELVDLLNDYFTRMVRIVEDHGGLVNKFIGDAMMIVWGGLLDEPINSEPAIRAALAMREELVLFNKEQLARGRQVLNVGVGINSGDVLAGHLGSRDRLEWTVMGDAVNLAQRAESIARHGQILVTPDAFEPVADLFVAAQLEPVPVKGKREPVAFYNVVSGRDEPEPVADDVQPV